MWYHHSLAAMAGMSAKVKKCFGLVEEPVVSSVGVLHGCPLMGYAGGPVSFSPQTSWSMAMATATVQPQPGSILVPEPSSSAASGMLDSYVDPAQALRYDPSKEDEATRAYVHGGMLLHAKTYESSMFLEGLKYYSDKFPHRLMYVTSTCQSNWRSREEQGMAFAAFEVWESHAPGHTKDEGKGMTTEPKGMNSCLAVGNVADHFGYLDIPFQKMRSLEDVLDKGGIIFRLVFNNRAARSDICLDFGFECDFRQRLNHKFCLF